jgi:hypothetical protein
MNTTSKHPLLNVFKALSYSFKSLFFALILSAILKFSVNDGGWVNYAVLSVALIIVSLLGQFFLKVAIPDKAN